MVQLQDTIEYYRKTQKTARIPSHLGQDESDQTFEKTGQKFNSQKPEVIIELKNRFRASRQIDPIFSRWWTF